jgi:hypothetical protein
MKTHTIIKSTIAALTLASISTIHGQTAAPGASESKAEAKGADLGTMNISITYEAYSLPIAKAGELQRKGLADEELYKEFVSAGKIERLLVLRTKSGQRAVLENITLYKFPTEFSQPQIPCGMAENKIQLPVVATAFEKVDVGDSVEVEPTLSSDAKSADFQIAVSHVNLTRREKWGQGLAELEQPQYESQKISTNATVSVGSPRLLGTLNPPFGNGLAARAEQNVWFCFITVTVAQNYTAPQKKAAR